MRIALISDIHGNTVALDAVLHDIERQGADLTVCLGDIAAGGPDPGGAIDRLAELGCIAVQGNTDAGMVDVPAWWHDPTSIGLPDDTVPGLATCVWGAEQLSPEQRHYLEELPLTAAVALGPATELLAFHGSPRSFDDFISATTPADDLEPMLEGVTADLLAGGHTHVPLIRRHGTRTIINPGSVGMPFAEYGYAGGVAVQSHAAYGLLTATATHETSIDLRQVAVDATKLEASVAARDMPHGSWWLGLRGSAGRSIETA